MAIYHQISYNQHFSSFNHPFSHCHIQNFQKYIPIESTYFSILLKMIGITYITEFSSDICKDAGYGALANQIGIAGKVTLISLSIPAITSLFTCVMEWWG